MAIVQKPVFHFYLVVPLVIFFIDKMIIISRSKVEIKVVKVELLPSGKIFEPSYLKLLLKFYLNKS